MASEDAPICLNKQRRSKTDKRSSFRRVLERSDAHIPRQGLEFRASLNTSTVAEQEKPRREFVHLKKWRDGLLATLHFTADTLIQIPEVLVQIPEALIQIPKDLIQPFVADSTNDEAATTKKEISTKETVRMSMMTPHLLSQDRVEYSSKKKRRPVQSNTPPTYWTPETARRRSFGSQSSAGSQDDTTAKSGVDNATTPRGPVRRMLQAVGTAAILAATFPASLVLVPFLMARTLDSKKWKEVRPKFSKRGIQQLQWLWQLLVNQWTKFIQERTGARLYYIVLAGFALAYFNHGDSGGGGTQWDDSHRWRRRRSKAAGSD